MTDQPDLAFLEAVADGSAAPARRRIRLGVAPRTTKGVCDPAPDPYHVQQQSKGEGDVLVWIAYGWDGASVYPDCHGPLVGARTQNTSPTVTWFVHLLGRRGHPVTVAIPPNSTRTYTAAQLSAVGLDTVDDISDLTLTKTSTP